MQQVPQGRDDVTQDVQSIEQSSEQQSPALVPAEIIPPGQAPVLKRRRGMHRGRSAGFVMSEEHRTKIQKSRVLTCLIEHVETKGGTMTASQVTAGIALLRKVLPDLSNIEIKGDENSPVRIVISAADAEV